MTNKPTILFYEANDFRFYGAGRVLLWLLERLERVQPLFVAPGDGVLTQRVRAAGIEAEVVPLPARWRRLDERRGKAAKAGKAILSPTLLSHSRQLARLMRQRHVRGVHANSTRAAIYAGLAARMAGVPMWWHLRLERPPGWSERLAYRLSDRVICVSGAVQKNLGLGDKTVVVLDGVPAEHMRFDADGRGFRRSLGWPDDAVVVGDVGSLTPRKRHDLFIRIALELAPRYPHARFLICGGSPPGVPDGHEQELRNMAAPLLAENQLAMPGYIEDMPAAYAAMDALVFPTDLEGFGLVAVEAMMMGVPVVRTDTAGAEDMIVDGETGFLVPTGDFAALSDRTSRLLADPNLRQRIGQAGQSFARATLTASRMAAEMETLMLSRLKG
ncbi:MAG: glycosyltransferase family 4 protein [Caldilineales bacterium]|nr:glycosyltransferase family 4 protein [Caldilineales bacterium]